MSAPGDGGFPGSDSDAGLGELAGVLDTRFTCGQTVNVGREGPSTAGAERQGGGAFALCFLLDQCWLLARVIGRRPAM